MPINVSENRRAIKIGQPRDTGKIGHKTGNAKNNTEFFLKKPAKNPVVNCLL